MPKKLRKISLKILLVALALVLVVFASANFLLRGSLARLSGTQKLPGLTQQVVITRDALGVPDIKANSRQDAAMALGYLHGQERFFQMDLQRRSSAGELSELLGSALLSTDRSVRIHRFRSRAQAVVAALKEEDQEILRVYAQGVNSGLDDLRVRPFEYLFLRQKPNPWQPTDSILTLYAMFLDLSYSTAQTEEIWAMVRDNLTPAMTDFFLPKGNPWEAPLQNDPVTGIVIPDSTQFDIRKWDYALNKADQHSSLKTTPHQDTAGSNNWAVAGNKTGHGGAILANDMHLGHGLPNIWYRASMSWPENGKTRRVVGVTLPGTPAMVVGSNGQIAWGFTNSYGDWADLVILEFDPENPARYRTAEGWKILDRRIEIINSSDGRQDTLKIDETIWGPIWTTDTKGRKLALRWTAHDLEAANINLRRLESATSIDEAMSVAATVGIPQQNLVCVDDQGRIGWTIAGPIPNRVGWDGRLPVSWADGTCRWDGYRNPADQPRIVDPQEGLLWTANNRITAGYDLAIIGDGGYGLGARARQIRDDLRALDHPVEKDLLAVQLDDRALMMGQWRNLILEAMKRMPPETGSTREDFLKVVRDQWSGRAEPSSVAYRLVSRFSYMCVDGVHGLLLRELSDNIPGFRASWLPYRHAVTWEVLAARPAHLLPPWSSSWDELLMQAVDRTMEKVAESEEPLDAYTWGAINTVVVAHPFTQFVPQLTPWLSAPAKPMPGASFMPRVQHRRSGASQRLVVSPGKEEEGIFHMPGGQSGHPLSPFFLKGHDDWVNGIASPLLPGEVKYSLVLTEE